MNVQFQDDLAAGVVLVRPALQSPDYVPGVSGWAVMIDGSAEFNDVTIRGGTTVGGTSLYYDGTPAAGNLAASITVNSGSDSFGNPYLGGITAYAGDVFASLNVGNLLLGLVSDSVRAGVVGLVGGDGIAGISPFSATRPDTSSWQLQDGDFSVTPHSSANYPHIQLDGTVWAADPVLFATNPGNVWAAETWHSPSYNANWSGTTTFGTVSGGVRTLQYRKDAEDNVWVNGAFVPAAGAGSAVFALPVGYRPAVNTAIPVAFISSGGVAGNAWLYVSAAGNLNLNSQFGSAVTTGTAYYVNGKFPLGNVA